MNANVIRATHNRDPRDANRAGMALIGGGREHVGVEFGRCYGRSSGYAARRHYAPRTSPSLFRCR